jgi:hypothetical protein
LPSKVHWISPAEECVARPFFVQVRYFIEVFEIMSNNTSTYHYLNNCSWSYYFRPNDPRDKRLPKDLKLAALRLAASKHSSRTLRHHPDARPTSSNPTSGNAGGTSEAVLRRMEQRLDTLTLQMELILKGLDAKLDKFIETVGEESSADKKSLLSERSTKSLHSRNEAA